MRKLKVVLSLLLIGLLIGCGGGGGTTSTDGGGPNNIPDVDDVLKPNPDEEQIPEEDPLVNFFDDVENLGGMINCQIYPVVANGINNAIRDEINLNGLGGQTLMNICSSSYISQLMKISDLVASSDVTVKEYNGQEYVAFAIDMSYSYNAQYQVSGATFYATQIERSGAMILDGILAVNVVDTFANETTVVEFKPEIKDVQNHGTGVGFTPVEVTGWLMNAEPISAVSDGTYYVWQGNVMVTGDITDPDVASWWNSNIEYDLVFRPVVVEPQNETLEQIMKFYCSTEPNAQVPLTYASGPPPTAFPAYGTVYTMYFDDFQFYSSSMMLSYDVSKATLSGSINGAAGISDVTLTMEIVDSTVANAKAMMVEITCQ